MKQIKKFKKEFTTKWAQLVANVIISQLQNAKTDDEFMFWMERGHMLDLYCVNRDIYLN